MGGRESKMGGRESQIGGRESKFNVKGEPIKSKIGKYINQKI